MLISEQDAASVNMRAALGTCPLLSLAGHFLASGYALTGALLVAAPVTDFSANSFSSEIRCDTPVSTSRCVAANSDHLLVNTFVDFVRA